MCIRYSSYTNLVQLPLLVMSIIPCLTGTQPPSLFWPAYKRDPEVSCYKLYWMYIWCGYNILMLGWFVFHILHSEICPADRSKLLFRADYDDYPLLHSHRYNWNKYRFIIGFEYREIVICAYSSQPDYHIFLHVRDICYSSSNTSILSRVQPLSFTLII